jgi:Fur family transcriptional regulator, ferric uptake regulator
MRSASARADRTAKASARPPSASRALASSLAASSSHAPALPWDRIPDELRRRGLRWTSQRATLLSVLRATDGHVTGSQLVDRCREVEPATTPSTVYRTLDVLEKLGVISHSHGLDGHEEFHVRPVEAHGHLICAACGSDEELTAADATPFLDGLQRDRGFVAALDHLTVVGRCRRCREESAPPPPAAHEPTDGPTAS